MTETELKNYIAAIRPADRDAWPLPAAPGAAGQAAGSLGALEDMSVRLAASPGRYAANGQMPGGGIRRRQRRGGRGRVLRARSVTVQQAVNMTRLQKPACPPWPPPSATMWRWWTWAWTAAPPRRAF